ncbi:class I SAM-dependent methyltransferase [Delftia acidovorans]|uniref:Class I SAM-dependent methyltransferase n=1 Tax=Delftia acidovorans TaxID=80866 RepID=A0AAJ2R0P0_DELAC|nr:class I SAM-dependent methyltransferase [Delftia acidovorans]MDX4953620.1 class I SAM-dependent methyltransferase [Delftia acidovorans]
MQSLPSSRHELRAWHRGRPCTAGVLAIALTRRGAHVTGIDADRHMLEAAQARAAREAATLRLALGQADTLPFPDASFDRVVAIAVLCFVPQAQQAVSEMARVLRPDGRLLIGEVGRWNLWAARRRLQAWFGHPVWAAAHFRAATDLRRLVQDQGLTVSDTRGATYYPPWGIAASVFSGVDP